MNQHSPQEGTSRIFINDMVKKLNVLVKPNVDMLACILKREKRRMKPDSIVPIIGGDTIVYSFGVPLFPLWLSYRTLKWIRCAFLEEPSGKAEHEEGSKIMWRCTLLTNIGSSAYKASFFAQCTYVHEAMNKDSKI